MGLLKDIKDGIYNLLLGLGVTAKRLPERAVTLQYPDERWEMPERSRGVVVLLSDKETGKLNCTACMLCQKACPTAAIIIEREKNEQKRWYPTSFTIDNTICCFCGLCEEACNFAALKMATMYEFSVYDQSELVYDINRLQELGRDVPYTPIPKKKPVAKPAAKPVVKPAADTDKTAPEAAATPKTETKDKSAAGATDAKPTDTDEAPPKQAELPLKPDKPDPKTGS